MAAVVAVMLAASCAAPRARLAAGPAGDERRALEAEVARGHGGTAALTDLAWAEYFDGDAKRARTHFDLALELAPANARALLGRATLQHEAGQFEPAWAGWWRILAIGDRRDPWWPAVAEVAARKLEGLVGDLPDNRAERDLERIDAPGLPENARRRLLAARATYARGRGDEAAARGFDRARGCPDRLWRAGPYGHLPRLDLARPFPPDTADVRSELVRTRGCHAVLDGDPRRPGVAYAVGFLEVKRRERVDLVVATEQPYQLYVDGQLVFSQVDEDRYPPRSRRLGLELVAGRHRLALKLASPGGGVELELAALADPPVRWTEPANGARKRAPRVGPVTVLEPAAPPKATGALETLGLVLAAQAALDSGDPERGEELVTRVLARAPHFTPAYVLAAQLASEDPSWPGELAHDRARRLLEHALALDPTLTRARYNLAVLELNADRPREALERLDDHQGVAPSWRVLHLRYQALRMRGWMHEAEEALAAGRRSNPQACALLQAEVQLRREHHDIPRALELAPRAALCSGGSDDLADLLRETGDLTGAVREYRRLVELDPEREGWKAGLAQALEEVGALDEAEKLFEQLLERYPRASRYRLKLADLEVARGQEARARRLLEAGLEETPESRDLERGLAALCSAAAAAPTTADSRRLATSAAGAAALPGPQPGCAGRMDAFRVDGPKVIAAFERDQRAGRARYQAPAVIVLDRTVTRAFPSGARFTLTHNIIKVLEKDGIDKWGEVQIPEGADVLTLRTVKSDGSTREPEEIAEKQSVSAPDLEVGDYVEFEYLDAAPPPAAFPGGFLAERFYFRSFDAPLDRTEYVLVAPRGLKLTVDRRGDAPRGDLEQRGELAIHTWSLRRQPQAILEPSAAPVAEYMPSVRAASGISLDAWRQYLREQAFGSSRSNLELREIARAQTEGLGGASQRVRALDAWVRRHIKQGGALDEAATSVLARGQGSRIRLLKALLGAAGVPSEIWLARGLRTARLDGPLPDLEAFEQPILHAAGLWIDPRYRHSPASFLMPALRGAQALSLGDTGASLGLIPSASSDQRITRFDIQLAADGSAEVKARERLRGWPALLWRESLDKLEPGRVRPEFEQHTLGVYFPGATLEELRWSGAEDDDGEFTVEYRFRAPALARRVGGRLVLGAPYPARLERRYVGIAARRTPLAVDYAAPTFMTASVIAPPGTEVRQAEVVSARGFGEFEQSSRRTPSGLELESRFSMPSARVPPDRYAAFVDFAARVDRAESKAAELLPRATGR